MRRPLTETKTWDIATGVAGVVWRAWDLEMPSERRGMETAEFSMALLRLDTASALPIPELGCIMRPAEPQRNTEHPFHEVLASMDPVDYAWDGRPGAIATVLGEEVALCLCEDRGRWLATTRESAMAEMLEHGASAPPVDADAVLAVNWRELGGVLGALLQKCGRLQLLPEMNAQEVDAYLGKYARSMAQLGNLRITGKITKVGLMFSGTLVAPEAEGDRQP
jgi:hypothetical protein